MSVRINTNVAAMRAGSSYSRVERDDQTRRARLASGLAINSGKDSGARLSISEGMRAEIGGLQQGTRNAEYAIDLLRTAEGAMNQVSAMLLRMRELAAQSSSDTLNDRNREATDSEFNQLKDFIDRTARITTYNNSPLLAGFGNEVEKNQSSAISARAETGVCNVQLSGADAGTYRFVDEPGDHSLTLGNGVTTQTVAFGVQTVGDAVAPGTVAVLNFDRLGISVELAGDAVEDAAGSYVDGDLDDRTIVIQTGTGGAFQLGSDAVPADRIEYDLKDFTTSGTLLDIADLSVGTRDTARLALTRLDQTINRVAGERGAVGAILNRLQHTTDFTSSALEHLHASESTVRDTDFAWESSRLARNEILKQTSMAVMMQAQIPVNMVMGLLQ